MRKKTITCTSTRNGFFKKIATSKFCVCYDLLFAPNSTAWYLLIQNFSLLNLRWLLKGKTCSMIVGMISLKLCPCLLKCSPVGFVRSFCEMYPLCSLNLSQNLRLVSPMQRKSHFLHEILYITFLVVHVTEELILNYSFVLLQV